MNLHLVENASRDRQDRRLSHLSTRLIVPPNITIIAMLPISPKAQSIREHLAVQDWLLNRIFRSYENLVDHYCHAWNKLVDQPWRIMSIGLLDRAHAF